MATVRFQSVSPSSMATMVDGHDYYQEYHGHPVADLENVASTLRSQGKRLIWTAGDSSLDNKFWFRESHDAVNGYETFLSPPKMKADFNYWMNFLLEEGSLRGPSELACINTAIEATSLNNRACGSLLPQDQLIHDSIRPEDYLIVSVGGNDVALTPVLCTVCSMLALVYGPTPTCCVRKFSFACPPNIGLAGDCGCRCCGVPNCISSCLCGCPVGYPYMVDLFKNRVGNYVRKLVAKTKPKKVIICMIYHLDEATTGSWADGVLGCLCYNNNPARLQAGIEAAFRHGTQQIRIAGTEVVPFPLFKVLDGKTTSDYCQRVEPSPQGGRKMATALLEAVLGPAAQHSSAPPQMVMEAIAE